MSVIIYKQRHISSNIKKTKVANYAHIQYIATRPRVMKNDGMSHGLFGRLNVGETLHFTDYKDIAQLVYGNTQNGVTMYRGIISVSEETAKELTLKSQLQWKRYIERHIGTISTKNNINRENFAFVCAVHNEKSHPHIHIAFWDKSQADKVKNPYVSPKIPNAIRQQLIKDTFSAKILAFAKAKDDSVKSIRQVTTAMVEAFEQSMQIQRNRKYILQDELDYELNFPEKFITGIIDKVFALKAELPTKGRLAYGLLRQDCKIKVDDIVSYILANQADIRVLKAEYIGSKMQIAYLYGGSYEHLEKQYDKYDKEANKFIANSILSMVKAIGKAEYEQSTKDYLATQLLYEIFDMLSVKFDNSQIKLDSETKRFGDLSKEAKKELYLKMQDKGYER